MRVQSCARCGQDHENLRFERLTVPIEDLDGTLWTHWALCPVTNEPILMKYSSKELTL